MIFHITTIVRRSSRRIMGTVGERRNWCGGAFTDHDVTASDARRIVRTDYQDPNGWTRCEACFAQLLEQDYRKAGRAQD